MQKKILIVEDSVTLARMISAVLTHANYEVGIAENGEEAIESIRSDKFDLIMLDLMMPVMDGKEFLQLLRSEYQVSTPVLVYTGSHSDQLEQELLDIGASQVAFKPLGAQKLLSLVNDNMI